MPNIIGLATSSDLWNWSRYGTLFTGGIDGRDPMVLNLGSSFNDTWIIYYTGTNPDALNVQVDHVTYYRTSSDLIHWSGTQNRVTSNMQSDFIHCIDSCIPFSEVVWKFHTVNNT